MCSAGRSPCGRARRGRRLRARPRRCRGTSPAAGTAAASCTNCRSTGVIEPRHQHFLIVRLVGEAEQQDQPDDGRLQQQQHQAPPIAGEQFDVAAGQDLKLIPEPARIGQPVARPAAAPRSAAPGKLVGARARNPDRSVGWQRVVHACFDVLLVHVAFAESLSQYFGLVLGQAVVDFAHRFATSK